MLHPSLAAGAQRVGTTTENVWRRVDLAERRLCLSVNRGCHRAGIRGFFAAVSRLGDGPIWYVLVIVLAVAGGPDGAMAALQMTVGGVLGIAIYKFLKQRLVRERPFVSHDDILCGTAPLDRYSFPSGHTLHAVNFTALALTQVPELGLLLVPFAALVAASRVVLGLHYPTDVVAGAAIGALLATGVLEFWPG
ncbi:MAG: phosphatase PAP2 family protein [Lysobacterales bacterium]|nr:MAG: phosphatase PAP2 family protein [Xanthomonadales bacterium]